MSELEKPQRRSGLVDLYRLLGLSPLETDVGRIKTALDHCLLAAKSDGQSAAASRAARIVELGKKNLLDSKRKAAYDRQWQRHFGKVLTDQRNSQSAAQDNECDRIALRAALPTGDPHQAFDLAAYLEATQPGQRCDRQSQFQRLLDVLGHESSTAQRPALSTELAELAAEQLTNDGSEIEVKTLHPATKYSAIVSAQGDAAPTSKSLARSIRKKRDRSHLLFVGGMVLSVAAVLTALLVVVKPGQTPQRSSAPQFADGGRSRPAQASEPPQTDPALESNLPRGSGLPKVEIPRLGPEPNQGLGDAESNAGESATSVGSERISSTGKPDAGGDPGSGASPGNGQQSAGVSVMQSTGAETEITEADKQRWLEDMLEIRRLLGQQQYEAAQAKLQLVTASVRNEIQQKQLARLVTVAQLAGQCHASLIKAIGQLSAGDTFQVRSTPVSFVEGDQQLVVLRISGENKRYALTEIPIGILEGLLDLQLDSLNLEAQAKKAAFILLHPTANELVLPRVRRMLQEAEKNGRVPPETIAIFDDDYRL